MSHDLFLRCVRRRISGNPQEPLLERFLIYLTQRGYAPGTWYRLLPLPITSGDGLALDL